MLPHPLTNFEIKKYYQNEPKSNNVYSRNNSPEISDGVSVTNLDKCKSIGIHWLTLYMNSDNAIYFASVRVEHIPKEIKKFIGNKNITTHIYRIQSYDSIMCQYFWIGFIDFMSKGKSLLDYTNLFSPNKYENNDKIILKYFQ